MKKQYDDNVLLEQYRSIWNNRLLSNKDEESEVVLFDAINRELQDENSHPRVRRSRYEKYYSAVKRITESSISNEMKVVLIELHNDVMEQLSKESLK
jgi:hypothetical protein